MTTTRSVSISCCKQKLLARHIKWLYVSAWFFCSAFTGSLTGGWKRSRTAETKACTPTLIIMLSPDWIIKNFIYLRGRHERKEEKGKRGSSMHWWIAQILIMRVTEEIINHAAAFPATFAGSWFRSVAARTETGAQMPQVTV